MVDEDRDEVPHDDTSDPDSIESPGAGDSDDDSLDELSLAATENELLEKVREWFYYLLGGSGFVVTLFIGISLYINQHNNLKRAFHLLSPESISLKNQIGVLEQIAVQRVQGDWPNAIASHLELSEWMDQTSLLPIVLPEERHSYETYSVAHVKDWLPQNITLGGRFDVTSDHRHLTLTAETKIHAQIFDVGGDVATNRSFYLPLWQTVASESSTPLAEFVNLDIQSTNAFNTDKLIQEPRLGVPMYGTFPMKALANQSQTDSKAEPWIPIIYPVKSDGDEQGSTVALILGVFSWRHVLPTAGYLSMIVESTCGGNQTYYSHYRGSNGGLQFLESTSDATKPVYAQKTYDINSTIGRSGCSYKFHVSPSPQLHSQYVTYAPVLYPAMFLGFVALVCAMFHGYDVLVEERQKVVLLHSSQADAIISSLFPRQVRERLMRRNSNASEGLTPVSVVDGGLVEAASAHRIKHFLSTSAAQGSHEGDSPIADLFPNCTGKWLRCSTRANLTASDAVMFADIAGFTAWSSRTFFKTICVIITTYTFALWLVVRDPSQVFKLLEAVYSAFDAIARRRGVFKVETIGDSYVCVTGLPDPQTDHALIMARFARDCRTKFKEVTRKLELSLGPDTGDLCMRFGMHSGPVTAGVLRGEKSRFQLFGDTVNTSARMESTGVRDCIQVSQATADLLIDGGKGYWIRPRDTMVHAKGKGEMQTFWIDPSSNKNRNSSLSSGDSDASPSQKHLGESPIWGIRSELAVVELQRNKHQRLIDYNVDLLTTHLKRVVARRRGTQLLNRRGSSYLPPQLDEGALSTESTTVLDEVVPVIRLPQFDANAFKKQIDPESIELPDAVKSQLKRYVTVIAAMYRQNPCTYSTGDEMKRSHGSVCCFTVHNWEHVRCLALQMISLVAHVLFAGFSCCIVRK